MAENMNSATMNTSRNHMNVSITRNHKQEGISSYTRRVQVRRPTYWDLKPGYRAINSPGLHLYQAFGKVAMPWPPIIPTRLGDQHVGPQVEFVKSWPPAISPSFKLQDKSGNSLPPVIFPGLENPYIEPQDKLKYTANKDGAIYDSEELFFLPPRSKLAGNTTKASPSANDQNPYNVDQWWIRGDREEKRKGVGDTFLEGSSVHSSDLPEDNACSTISQLHHPRPQRWTSAEVIRLELQARIQTPSLNLAGTSPLDCAYKDRPCVESSRNLLDPLRTRFEDAKKATVHKKQVELINLSESFGPKRNKNMIPNDTHEDPIDSSVTGGPQVDLLSSSPSPRLEARDSDNIIVPCKHQVGFISFDMSTDPPHPRTTTPLYQKTDLLSRDSSPLLRFEANLTPKEKVITLDFCTSDSGTSFIYQPPPKTPLNQALLLGLLFLFFVPLARLITQAEGMKLWILVLALGLWLRDLTGEVNSLKESGREVSEKMDRGGYNVLIFLYAVWTNL